MYKESTLSVKHTTCTFVGQIRRTAVNLGLFLTRNCFPDFFFEREIIANAVKKYVGCTIVGAGCYISDSKLFVINGLPIGKQLQ